MKKKDIKPSETSKKKEPNGKGLKIAKSQKKISIQKKSGKETTATAKNKNKRTPSKAAELSVEEKFKVLSEITSDYVFSVIINDDNSKKLDWITNEFKKEMGFPFQNLLNAKSWKKYFPIEDHEKILGLSRNIYKNKKVTAEFRIIKNNGSVTWQRGTFRPIYDRKKKRVVSYYGTLEDITEKKKIEFDLVELNNELEQRIEEKTSLLESAVLNLKHEVSIRAAAEKQIRESEKIISDVAKNLDKKLRESEYKHLWNVFEHSEIATVTVAKNGICLNYNQAAEKLFGYSHEELPNIESWLVKLFPNESYRARVRAATYHSIEKEIPSQNFEIDVTVKSGEVKNLILQINNILHEGTPIGVQIGQLIDISEQRKAQQTINQIAEGISTKTGQKFFDALVENLTKAANADFALVVLGEKSNGTTMRTISAYGNGKILENFSYELAGTPCENVYSKELCIYPRDVANLFPHNEMLKDLFIEGYAGVPLYSSKDVPLGLLVVLSKKAFNNISLIRKLLMIFSARAATEIESQHTLDELSSSENRFRIISEQTGDLIFEYDLESGSIFRDGDIKAILGYEKEDYQKLTKEEWLKLVHPDDVAQLIKMNSEAIQSSKNLHYIFRFRHNEGHYITLEQSGIVLKDTSGKTKRFLGRLKDVTNDRAREKHIELQATLLNSASDSILLLDTFLNILYANDRACDTLGYSQSELINKNIRIISPTANNEKNALRVNQIREKNNFVFETIHTRKDGTTFPVEVNSKVIKIEGEEFILSVNRDITERKKLESDLKSALEKYKILFNSFPLGILVANHEGIIIESNQAIEMLFETSGTDFKSRTIDNLTRRIVKPDKSPMPANEYASVRALKEGIIIRDVEVGIVKENNVTTWLSVTAAPLPTYEGGVVVTYADITQKIEAEKALKESEERYRKLIDSSPFALLVHKEGRVLFANEACIKLFHAQNSSQVIGKNIYDYMHPDYLSIAQTRLRTVAELNAPVPLIELKYYCHDNVLIDVQTSAIPITYSGESAILVVANDVTERNLALSRLRESETRLRFLIETSPIIVFSIDKNGIFTLSQGNGLSKIGLKPGEVVGLSALEVYKDHAEILAALKRALKGIETREIATVGDTVFDISYTPLLDKNGNVESIAGIAYDVTVQRQFEEELLKSAHQWQATFDAVSDAVWLVDLSSVILRANKATEKILNKPINQIIGRRCYEVLHGIIMPLDECPVQKMKISLQREFMELQRDDRWFLVTADPIFNDEGKLTGAVHSISDVTENYNFQEKLKQSEALYRLLSDNSADVIWLLDLKTFRFSFVSPSVYKLRGYTSEEVLQQSLEEVMTKESFEYVTNNLPIAIEAIQRGEHEFVHIRNEIDQIHKNGRIIPTEVVITILLNEQGIPEQILGVSRDITDRKETQKKLLESEERYRRIIEQAPEAIFVHANGEFVFANRATLELVGVTSFEELKSKKLVDYLHPDSIELVLQRMSILNRREAEQIPHVEYKLIKNDGTLAYIESTASAIEFNGMRAIQSVVRDVTERKNAERALKESQERFRHVVEYSPNAILIHQNGKIVYGNPAVVELIGAFSIDEIINRNVLDFMHPDYKAFAIERIKSAAISMKPLPPAEEKIIRLDKKVLDVEIVSVPFYLNNALAYQIIIRDITEIKSKTEELRKLSRAVEQNSASVTITNADGIIEYVNPKFLETTGYTLEEVIGKNPRILKSGNQGQEFYINLWNTISAGNEWRGEFQNMKKNGEIYWEFASISPIKNSSGKITHFVAIKEDITDRKKFDDEMLIVKDEAEHAYKVKTSLLANMSHELRTPLNGIIGFSQLLRDYVADEEGKMMVEKIVKSGQRLSNTFTEILSLSELEMGDVEIKNAPIDLAVFCQELKMLFADRAYAKNLSFEVDLAFECQETYSDEGWLIRIATHLLDNAIKFTAHGGITIQLARPIVKNEIEYAVINIIDTGIGIRKEEYKALFKEFKQLSEGTRRDFEGLGLGLSLTKRMAQNLNCLITFESELDKGSTFTILIPLLSEIPLEKEMPEPVMINKISLSGSSIANKSLRILLVEDNPLNIEVVERFLAKAGEVTSARDGESAVKAAQKDMFDLLLVDISLGHGMDGIEVLKHIRLIENYSNVPAIALTGYVSETNKRRFQVAGFNGFLGKPFEKKDLLNYISKIFKESD